MTSFFLVLTKHIQYTRDFGGPVFLKVDNWGVIYYTIGGLFTKKLNAFFKEGVIYYTIGGCLLKN